MKRWCYFSLSICIILAITGCSLTDKNLLSTIKLHQITAEQELMEAQQGDNWSGSIPIITYKVYLEVPKKFKRKSLDNLGISLVFDENTFKIYGVSGSGIGGGKNRSFESTDHPDYNLFMYATGQGGSHITEEQIEYLHNNTDKLEIGLYWNNKLVHTIKK
jgi:hypothetical protein